MEEIERNNNIRIEYKTKGGNYLIEGTILDFSNDRILVNPKTDSIVAAKILKELDDIEVSIFTSYGIKYMKSSVMSALDDIKNCLIIEKTPIIKTEQRREYVRITKSFEFNLFFQNKKIKCYCVNISAGGIAFNILDNTLSNDIFVTGDSVILNFPQDLFEKNIVIDASIIKTQNNKLVAKYKNLNSKDEDKIVKYIFKVMTRNAS